MEKSIQTVELTQEDITKLKGSKAGNGCLFVLIFFLVASVVVYILNIYSITILLPVIVVLLLLIAVAYYVKKKDSLIDKDLQEGQKKIIIAPIQNKNIKTSDVTTGRRKGEIDSKYSMTINGKKYEMSEGDYLTIKNGEFLEIHEAPHSGVVIKGSWLKEDGTSVELNFDEL